MDMKTNAASDKMMLRFPNGWHAAIKVAAARNGRSLNAEILFRLKESVMEDIEAERRFAELSKSEEEQSEEK